MRTWKPPPQGRGTPEKVCATLGKGQQARDRYTRQRINRLESDEARFKVDKRALNRRIGQHLNAEQQREPCT